MNNASDEQLVRSLYQKLLESWNSYNADEYANLFAQDGNLVGFDGSQVNGSAEIRAHLSEIFADHRPASYVYIIRTLRFISPDVAVLSAVAGMIPPGQSAINPELNAIQTLVAVKQQQEYRIAVFHNTPAAFHGRDELRKQLTDELQQVPR